MSENPQSSAAYDTADWVSRAEASRAAWEALSTDQMDEVLTGVRLDGTPCRACSDCSLPAMHREPHDCDCRARWDQ